MKDKLRLRPTLNDDQASFEINIDDITVGQIYREENDATYQGARNCAREIEKRYNSYPEAMEIITAFLNESPHAQKENGTIKRAIDLLNK